MASLLLETAGAPPRTARVFRALTTIGSSADCDVVVSDAGLEATHAQLRKDGEGFVVVGMLRDMTVNGRRERQARLADGDVIRIGELAATFRLADESASRPAEPEAAAPKALRGWAHVEQLSAAVLAGASTEALVALLLDAVIELTGADKGFLVLIEEGQPVIRAGRNVTRSTLPGAVGQLSDSILARVLETKAPLAVDDALAHAEWSASASVVSLGLHSVLCLPLMDGDEVRGLLYIGNDRVAHLFDASAVELATVFSAQASLLIAQRRRFEELTQRHEALEQQIRDAQLGEIVGTCDSMLEVFKRVRKVASTDISVLITGETGTGKELVAREVHRCSPRAAGPFVVINCGAIPEPLLESELFGHVKGAFTGAVADKKGRFQAADGGTLFLDEIGEMPMSLQVKLLRALQERVVAPVGASADVPVDIRVVAATNRDLEAEVKAGRFREDLYYRLDVVGVHLPPLRERGEDLDTLARYFLSKSSKSMGRSFRGFSKACLQAMRRYRWPGNVRELENRVKKACVLSDGPLVTAEDLDIRSEDLEEVLPLAVAKERFQLRYVQRVLERNGGNRTRAAKELGVDPRTVFRHLEKLADPLPTEDGALGLGLDDDALSGA